MATSSVWSWKRSPRSGGAAKGRIAGKTKEEDTFEHFFRASTHDYLLFFTDRGRVYRLKAFEVPQTSRQAMGTAIVNLIQISPTSDHGDGPDPRPAGREGFLLMALGSGEVKRTRISEFANLRANGLITFDLNPNDALKWVKHTAGNQGGVLTTVKGMAIRFRRNQTSGASGGRRAGCAHHAPGRGRPRVAMDWSATNRSCWHCPRTLRQAHAHEPVPSQSRGGKGIKTMDLTDKTGPADGRARVWRATPATTCGCCLSPSRASPSA
jgi:DNA gyrase subunit A